MIGKHVSAAVLGLALLAPVPALAAGIAGVTVDVVDPAGPTIVFTTSTDALGAFTVEDVLEGAYELVATDTLGGRLAVLDFAVDLATAPARLRGLVTEDGAATVSFAVSAFVTPMSFVDAGLTDARVQPRWNRNWPRSRGRLHVRITGTDLEAVTQVDLVSFPADPAAGTIGTGATITSTELRIDPIDGKLHALFPKGTAFTALAGPDARRGDVLPLQILVTTPAGIQPFEATVRIVGSRK